MRLTPLALSLLLALPGATAARPDGAAPLAEKAGKQMRSTYIVHFDEPPLASFHGDTRGLDASLAGLKATSPARTGARRLDVDSSASRAYREALSGLRAQRIQRFSRSVGRPLQAQFEYDVVLHAVALELNADEAAALARQPGVARVLPETISRPQTDAGPTWINAPDLWRGLSGVTTQGEGVVVGIVDSGINRGHPSFAQRSPLDGFQHANPRGRVYGLCTETAQAGFCNNKLIGIHDFTVCTGTHASNSCDDREPNDGANPDDHGTHVASTAVGNGINVSVNLAGANSTRRLSGVAPRANLISYKVCEEEEDCRGSWLLAGLNQAVADQVDVINYSIGGTAFDPWSSSDALAMLNAREAGVVVVVAAGNEGPDAASVTNPGDAPWVLAVANASHDRAVVNRLVDLSGGASAPPAGGILVGLGDTAGLGPRPIVRDAQFPGCSQGSDLDSPPSGASNPWPANRFNGEIVVCDRGVQARVAKSNNVRLAGGGGMILANTISEGNSLVSDTHSIPSTHIGFADGQALKTWLAGGTGHQGRIEGASVQQVAAFGDVLASSSGRGPTPTSRVLKPDLTAPGTAILAAYGESNAIGFLSGTSMATPHVAGAAALLVAARPQWGVSQIESALVTAALPRVRDSDGVTPATPFEQGAGRVDVSRAVAQGLHFAVTTAEFRAADPNLGGDPQALNRPSLVHDGCFERCTLTRRVTDMVGGASWRVEADLPSPASITITPSEFTLTAGETRSIAFQIDVSDRSFPGSWVDGRVRFVRTGGAAAGNSEIPVSVFADPGALPARLTLSGPAESGFDELTLDGLVALPEAGFGATALVKPTRTQSTLGQDPTRNDPFDSFGPGVLLAQVTVPASSTGAGRWRVVAELKSPTAYDLDLFVGEDVNGDGEPEAAEIDCVSAGPLDEESCEIEVEQRSFERVYWVLAQNFDAGVQGASDPTATDLVQLDTAAIDLAAAPASALRVTGPGRTDRVEPFTLRVAWDDPGLLPGERRLGYVLLGADADRPGQVGAVPVSLERSTAAESASVVLGPGEARRMQLAPQAAQDRLFIDVPPNATRLTVSSSGTGNVDLYLARAATLSSPQIDVAPARGQATVAASGPSAAEVAVVEGAALTPGRWYITPVNPSPSTVADFTLSAQLQYGGARPQPQFGAYFNPARSGAGLFLFPAGDLWGLAWYTYLQDGTPTWYLGVGAAPGPQDAVWRVALERFTWDGSAATGKRVGVAQLALTDANRFTFSWGLDGEGGAEPMVWIDGGACAQLNGVPAPLTGLWYSPLQSGYGYSINAYPGLESNGAYFYDAQGIARWALGQATPFGATSMVLSQRTGFCPLCAHSAPVATEIGTLTRRYDSASAGQISVDLVLQPPLEGVWSVDLPVSRISNALVCP